MNLSNFVAYVKQAWKNKPDTSTPLSAERLTHQEEGIKGNSDAIQELAAAVVSQIVNNPDKIASMAALYAVNQKVTTLDGKVGDTAKLPSGTADVASAIAQLYSNLNAKTPTFQERHLTADTQTLSSNSTTTLWDSEVTIPFDCIMIGNWKVLCKSSDANASFYYMVNNAYIQGREQWDGTVQTDNTINIFVMNKFTKGTNLSVSVQGNCSIRGNNTSLTRYNFTFIPL